MKKKILLPTDFSKYAWNAINYAIELFKDEPCDFYILNTFRESGYVLESMMVPEPGERLYELAKEEADKGLEKVFQQIMVTKGQNIDHKFIMNSKFNFLKEAVEQLVERNDIDLIIMGTKGVTDATRTIYGSNTVDIMEQIRSCPVIAVPADAKVELPKEIVFPTNYKIFIKKKELTSLIDIVKKTNASLKILHVVDGEEKLNDKQLDNKHLLEEYFEDVDYTFHTLDHSDTHSAITCFVDSRDANMIAFINKKHSFFGSILSKPLVKKLGYHSKIPVLVLRDK
ncbi:universal stress protein [Aquimarina agarivorans]|uniref:universal stress protein n=1 Tax=Aquimarina agarivorans TaxID=980584 RepID=UPI000248EBBF|nr:universal stress protein [Aquimarina agarivorans]